MRAAIDVNGLWRLRFDVSDTGSGHSRAEREHSVQADAQVSERDGQRKMAAPGSSWRSARKLAALMGGEVGCDSAVGKGSLYWFTLAAEQPGRAARG